MKVQERKSGCLNEFVAPVAYMARSNSKIFNQHKLQHFNVNIQ